MTIAENLSAELKNLAVARRQLDDAERYRDGVMASRFATSDEMLTAFKQLVDAEKRLRRAVATVVAVFGDLQGEAKEARQ